MAEQCEDFEPIFEMMTYYGILDREDGHCFRVEAFILEGSYLMATGAFLLAVSNSFVMKASAQYFWDKETTRKALAMEKQVPEDIYGDVTKEELKKIGPPPVLFTDTYRWVLRRENLGDTGGRLPRSSIAMLSAPPESAQPDPEYISTSSGAS